MRYSRPLAASALLLGAAFLGLGVHASPTPPQSIVVGVGADETQRTVTWLSSMRTGAVKVDGKVVPAESRRTQVGLFTHTATFPITPGTQVSYSVGAGGNWSAPRRLEAPASSESFSFAFLGDPQVGVRSVEEDSAGWRAATEAATAEDVDFLISGGDQVQQGIRPHYRGFFANEDLRTHAWAVANGNHDNRNRAAFVQRFGRAERHWAFEWKGVKFLMLDGNEPETIADFLRSQRPGAWTIAVIHQPPYTQGKLNATAEYIRDNLTGAFANSGIDLVLSGHNHSYTRSHPIEGVTYVAANSSTGSKFYELDGPVKDTTAAWNQDFTPDFTVVRVEENRISVSSRNVGNKKVVDEFTINH